MHDLTLHRILTAPRRAVWTCWTVPEHLTPWFAPKPVITTKAEIDLRPGGRFFTSMNVDGTDYPNDGSILDLVPESRLVFTDLLLADFQPSPGPFLGFTAILSFRDHPDGTEYDVLVRHKDAETAEKHAQMGFAEGWGKAADQLQDYAAHLAARMG